MWDITYGPVDAFPVDEEMEGGDPSARGDRQPRYSAGIRYQLIVALVAALVFLGCIISRLP